MPTNMCGIGAAVTVQAFGAPESLILCMCMAFHRNQWGVVSSSLALGHAQHSRLWGHKSLSKPALSVRLPGSPFEGLASTCITFLKNYISENIRPFQRLVLLGWHAHTHNEYLIISHTICKSQLRGIIGDWWFLSAGCKARVLSILSKHFTLELLP